MIIGWFTTLSTWAAASWCRFRERSREDVHRAGATNRRALFDRGPPKKIQNGSMISGWWFGTCILFFRISGMSSSQLTFIFFRGVETTNQISFNGYHRGLSNTGGVILVIQSWHVSKLIHLPQNLMAAANRNILHTIPISHGFVWALMLVTGRWDYTYQHGLWFGYQMSDEYMIYIYIYMNVFCRNRQQFGYRRCGCWTHAENTGAPTSKWG